MTVQVDWCPPAAKEGRRPPRKLMHFIDVGQNAAGQQIAEFVCPRCAISSGWRLAKDTEVRRGIPCPRCNLAGGSNDG